MKRSTENMEEAIDRKTKEAGKRKSKRLSVKLSGKDSIEIAADNFHKNIRENVLSACGCCHRLLFRKTICSRRSVL